MENEPAAALATAAAMWPAVSCAKECWERVTMPNKAANNFNLEIRLWQEARPGVESPQLVM
jgi:hypothetical protein